MMGAILAGLCALGGIVLGYVTGTLIESYFHQRVSDAPAKTVKFWLKFPRLFSPLLRANYSHHIVHHQRTFKSSHVVQFAAESEQTDLNKELTSRGNHGKLIRKANYAMRLGGTGALAFSIPFMPLCFAAYLLGNVAFAIGFACASSVSPLLNHFVHPYLHMTREEALRKSSIWLRWFIKTNYFDRMTRHHYLHHRRVACNFNLLLGGDRIREFFRSLLDSAKLETRKQIARSPTPIEIAEMRRIGLIHF
jgi:hypothetical protein